MKKLLLLSLMIVFAFGLFAQNDLSITKSEKRIKDGQELVVDQPRVIPEKAYGEYRGLNEDVTRIYIGMSGHQRPLRREEARVVDFDYELNVISVTSILDPETYDDVNELGIMGMWYSTDLGQTWEGPIILNNDLNTGPNYYLGGAHYNPVGNTNVNNMFGVAQGVLDMGSGDWNFKSFGTANLTGENQTNYLYEGVGDDGYWNIFGIGQIGEEMRLMNMIPGGPWGGYTSATFQPIVGTLDDTEFDWDLSNTVEANLYNSEVDGVMEWIGMWQGMDAGCEIAWSNDGQIGYMWMVGVSDDDATSYQPVVFYSEDSGDSWDYIYLDFFDGDMQDILEEYLIPASSGDYIPHVFESAGVVDMNGELQMMVAMKSCATDVFNYPDSIGYVWTPDDGDLFNLVVDADGLTDIVWVDSLRTDNMLADSEGNYCGTEGWQHRIYASKSFAEDQVFFTWLDTRDTETYELNAEPDLFGWSKGVCDDPLVMDEPICFSEGSEMETVFWFNSSADEAYLNGEGNYVIPTIQGCTPPEFYGNSSTSADPITFSYITGIEFPKLCYTGLEEIVPEALTVSQNIPNPFSGVSYIEINTPESLNVTIEVSNMMGQVVNVLDAGMIAGKQKIEISAEGLDAGIYFYTVHAGNTNITNKMIVR